MAFFRFSFLIGRCAVDCKKLILLSNHHHCPPTNLILKKFSTSGVFNLQASGSAAVMGKRAVIFDLGGVIVQQPQKALAKFSRKLNLPELFFESVMIEGRPDNAFCRMERGEITTSQFCDAFEKECHDYAKEKNIALPSSFRGQDLFTAFAETEPVPEIVNAIGVLKNKGMKLCLLTNNYIDDTASRGLSAGAIMNLRLVFDEILESCRLGVRKPDSRIYQEACHRLGVSPEEAVFLDDLGTNVKAARSLGISTILVKDFTKALTELQELTGINVFEKAIPMACNPEKICEGEVTTEDGVKLHFFEMGQGPPVILCHGFPEGWYCWRRQMPALAMSGYRAIALEMKGYGESSCPPDPKEYTMEKNARDVISFMDRMGIPQATFIGHDWGGMLVWCLALHYPERTRAVGAFNTPFYPPPKTVGVLPMEKMKEDPGAFSYQLYFQEVGKAESEIGEDLENFFKIMVRAARKEDFFPGYTGTNFDTAMEKGGFLKGSPKNAPYSILYDEQELAYSLSRIRKSGLRGMLNWYRNIDENYVWNVKGSGRKLLCPALMVTCEKDVVLTPASSRFMDKWMPNLTRGHLHCGHWSLLERPTEANEILLNWLNKVHSKPQRLTALL